MHLTKSISSLLHRGIAPEFYCTSLEVVEGAVLARITTGLFIGVVSEPCPPRLSHRVIVYDAPFGAAYYAFIGVARVIVFLLHLWIPQDVISLIDEGEVLMGFITGTRQMIGMVQLRHLVI